MKFLEDGTERKIVVDDYPFIEAETHFAYEKFYLNSYLCKGGKSNDVKSIKSYRITRKRIDAAVRKVKVNTKQFFPIRNEGKIMSSKKNLTSGLCYVSTVKKKVNYLNYKKIH